MAALTVNKGAFYPGVTQNILTSGTSQISDPVGATTSIIRISCQHDTYVQITNTNDAADATTDSMMILGGGTEFITVPSPPPAPASPPNSTPAPGVQYLACVSVLQVALAGIVSITELTGFPAQPGG
jgi:hypothetical protein